MSDFDVKAYIEKHRTDAAPYAVQPRDLEERVRELLAANTRLQEEARAARADKEKAEQVAESTMDALAAFQERRVVSPPTPAPQPPVVTNRTRAEQDFDAERRVVIGRYSPDHDARHTKDELVRAAAVYALDSISGMDAVTKRDLIASLEPWPTATTLTRRKRLIVAASYLLSEVERIDRRERSDARAEARREVKDELATMDNRCSEKQRIMGNPIPRTCKLCGLGPCLDRRKAAVHG